MFPKVSILVPCYNSEAYIGETLQSCVQQLYSNIEVIVVDDGSTDKTLTIAREWACLYPQIKVYAQNNAGVCKARNVAFEKCTGDYIMYLDADDVISLDKIQAQIKLLHGNSNCVIATCAWDRFNKCINEARFPSLSVYKDYDTGYHLIEDLLNGEMFGVSCYLVHRSLIEKAGLWDESLNINTDGEFFIRVLSYASRILFAGDGRLYYRSNISSSISRRKISEDKGLSLLKSYLLSWKFLNKQRSLSKRMQQGLYKSCLSVAYQYSEFPSVVKAVRASLVEYAGVSYCPIGGIGFRFIQKIVGFWAALSITRFIKRFFQ